MILSKLQQYKKGCTHEKAAIPTPDPGGPLRPGLQRPPGRGLVRGRPDRALRDYAEKNGYSIAREYIDEAESGRIADRPQFRKMIDEGGKATAPFQVILIRKTQ